MLCLLNLLSGAIYKVPSLKGQEMLVILYAGMVLTVNFLQEASYSRLDILQHTVKPIELNASKKTHYCNCLKKDRGKSNIMLGYFHACG